MKPVERNIDDFVIFSETVGVRSLSSVVRGKAQGKILQKDFFQVRFVICSVTQSVVFYFSKQQIMSVFCFGTFLQNADFCLSGMQDGTAVSKKKRRCFVFPRQREVLDVTVFQIGN